MKIIVMISSLLISSFAFAGGDFSCGDTRPFMNEEAGRAEAAAELDAYEKAGFSVFHGTNDYFRCKNGFMFLLKNPATGKVTSITPWYTGVQKTVEVVREEVVSCDALPNLRVPGFDRWSIRKIIAKCKRAQ